MRNEEIKSVELDDVTPESLMDKFKGPGLMKMIIVTVVFHLVVMVGFSINYILKIGQDNSQLSKEDRIEKAVADATTVLREIADEYELSPQDISDNFSKGGSRTIKKAVNTKGPKSAMDKELDDKKIDADATPPAVDGDDGTVEKPKSALEKQIKKAVDGPDMPGIDEEEDIF